MNGDESDAQRGRRNRNPNIATMKEDRMYHLGLFAGQQDMKQMFGDVKFVCMGGTPYRMEIFANYLVKELGLEPPTGLRLNDISKHSHRYSMFKVGPVLSISHGMGIPSMSILLHEVFKLLWHAGVDDAIFFRIGTSGGIGEPPGTVVVTSEALDGQLRNVHEIIVLGKVVGRKTKLNQDIVRDLLEIGKSARFPLIKGKTMATSDFYEGQARLDGAFCEYDEAAKKDFLMTLMAAGVKNIEMESTAFAALTHHGGFRSAVICVTLVDRLNEDQISPSTETLLDWQNRPQMVVGKYIKKLMAGQGKEDKQPAALTRCSCPKVGDNFVSYEDEGCSNRSPPGIGADSMSHAIGLSGWKPSV